MRMLRGKTIVVTGVASGIGAETAAELKRQGANVIGIDRNRTVHNVDLFLRGDLSDPLAVDHLVDLLPSGLNGLCNIAGLPPTAPPAMVLRVNCLGLKRLTEGLIAKFSDGAAITNIASLAGIGWPQSVEAIRAFDHVTFNTVEAFCARHNIAGARSYFFSKEYLLVWTYRNRWAWRHRGIRMNCISPGPVDTPILPDFIKTLGARVEEDMKVMDRPGTPKDIAPVVAFLQSDGSAWLRGSNIAADGGMSSHVTLAMHGLV
jgi:NAD(P)-dependent dehydrogenase (short-subunit alcohol dehydrogenase family)